MGATAAALSLCDSYDELAEYAFGNKSFIYSKPRIAYRENVTQELNPRITVPLIELKPGLHDFTENTMNLTVPQALELSSYLIDTVNQFCRRKDIIDALLRTEPLTLT